MYKQHYSDYVYLYFDPIGEDASVTHRQSKLVTTRKRACMLWCIYEGGACNPSKK